MKARIFWLFTIAPFFVACGMGLNEGNLAVDYIELNVQVIDETKEFSSVFLQPQDGNSGSSVNFDGNGLGSPVVNFSYPSNLDAITFQLRFTSTSEAITCTSVPSSNGSGGYLKAMTVTIISATQCVGSSTLYGAP